MRADSSPKKWDAVSPSPKVPQKVGNPIDRRDVIVLPRCNETFVPAAEQRISVYVRPSLSLALLTGAKGRFHNQSIFEPGGRSAPMPAAFSGVRFRYLICWAGLKAPCL